MWGFPMPSIMSLNEFQADLHLTNIPDFVEHSNSTKGVGSWKSAFPNKVLYDNSQPHKQTD